MPRCSPFGFCDKGVKVKNKDLTPFFLFDPFLSTGQVNPHLALEPVDQQRERDDGDQPQEKFFHLRIGANT
jgi:hypothetical protein